METTLLLAQLEQDLITAGDPCSTGLQSSVRLVEVMVFRMTCTKPWHIVCSVFTLMLVAEGASLNRSSTRAVMSGLIRCSTSCAWQLVKALIPAGADTRLNLWQLGQIGEENIHIKLLVPEPSGHSLPHHVSVELLQLLPYQLTPPPAAAPWRSCPAGT